MTDVFLCDLKNLKKYEPNIEPRNEIYIKNNILYKFYNSECFNDYENNKKVKLRFINKLLELKLDNCVIPNGKILDNDNFVGVYMNYYNDYFNLYDLLQINIDYDTKLNLLKKINITLKNIHKNNIVHGDIHLGNIITNLEDIKLIDLDESYFAFNKFDMNLDIKNLMGVIISILYDFDFENNIPFTKVEQREYIENLLNDIGADSNFKDLFKSIFYFGDSDEIIYPDEFLNYIDIEKIKNDKKKLNKKLKY